MCVCVEEKTLNDVVKTFSDKQMSAFEELLGHMMSSDKISITMKNRIRTTLDTLNPEQKTAMNTLIGLALQDGLIPEAAICNSTK